MKVDEFRKVDEALQQRRNKIDELLARKKANPTKIPKPGPKKAVSEKWKVTPRLGNPGRT